MNNRLVIVASKARSLRNFRGNLILDLLDHGFDITVFSPDIDAVTSDWLNDHNIKSVEYSVKRSGLNILKEIWCMVLFFRAMHRVRPDYVLSYTVKPVVWSGLYKLLVNSDFRFVALVTGLGYAFSGSSVYRRLLERLVVQLYKLGLRRSDVVVFQNGDNKDLFVQRKIVPEKKCHVVDGSGVDTKYFGYEPLKYCVGEKLVFLMVSRLLGEKGVREYAGAARIIKKDNPNCDFMLLGSFDASKDAISKDEVDQWEAEGIVNYLGETDDVRQYLKQSHVLVLPSYHEGLPRSVVEGMSVGRMVITTDIPGCKETVQTGYNGFLVEPGSSESLASAFSLVLDNSEKVSTFGKNSRELAVSRFNVDLINRDMISHIAGQIKS